MTADWPQLYADYLKSQEWAALRVKVMARAGHRCEGCRDAMATEVHHLTYANVTREFLFELVALCGDCHERLHAQCEPPCRPTAATWTRREKGPVGETAGHRVQRERLAVLAAAHRAKTMATELPPEHRDIPEAAA